jgi:hypothetical protein
MGANLNHLDNSEDELDLKKVIMLVLKSKFLILTITSFFTLTAFIYMSQKETLYQTSAIFEIGLYGEELLETPPSLIQNLNVNLIYKEGTDKFQLTKLEDRLLEIKYTSKSEDTNLNLISKIIEYSKNRHAKLLEKAILESSKGILSELENIEISIEYQERLFLESKELKRNELLLEINKLDNEAPYLKSKIALLGEIISEEDQNLILLKSKPDLYVQRAAQSPTLNQIIFSYKDKILDYKKQLSKIENDLDTLKEYLLELESSNLGNLETFEINSRKIILESQLDKILTENYNNSQLISGPKTSEISPFNLKILILGLLFGLFISFIIVFFKDYFNKIELKII